MIENLDVVIPTKNRWKDLIVTIEKLKELNIKENQITIIDDGSEKGSEDEFRQIYPIINFIKHEKSVGQLASRNELFNITDRKYILSLDDDSNLLSTADLLEAKKVLDNHQNVGVFSFNAFHQLAVPEETDLLDKSLRQVRTFIACGALFKRKVIERIGIYTRPELGYYGEEVDCSVRLFKKGYSVVTKDSLCVHHRVDLTRRRAQVKSSSESGVYGFYYRSKMGFSDNLILTGIYYPLGFDLAFILIYMVKRIMIHAIPNRDLKGYFGGLVRFLRFIPYILKNTNKLELRLFLKWIRLKTR